MQAMKTPAMIIGLAACLSCVLAGCAAITETSTDLGKQLFQSNCATCHGLSGKGDGPKSQTLPTKPANLTILAKKNGGVFPTQRVYEVIDGRLEVAAHGPRTMPVWGKELQVNLPDLPEGNSGYFGLFDFRESTVRDRIQALIDYLVQLQD